MSREETLRKLADAEANCLPINEDSIRKKYSKDVNKIKVSGCLILSIFSTGCIVSWVVEWAVEWAVEWVVG